MNYEGELKKKFDKNDPEYAEKALWCSLENSLLDAKEAIDNALDELRKTAFVGNEPLNKKVVDWINCLGASTERVCETGAFLAKKEVGAHHTSILTI